jgi:hypothetical protein
VAAGSPSHHAPSQENRFLARTDCALSPGTGEAANARGWPAAALHPRRRHVDEHMPCWEVRYNPSSEAPRLDWKKPLTRLAKLAALSPRDRALNDVRFQPSPEGRGWPAAGAFTSRSGPGEGSLLKKASTSSVLRPVNAGNSYSASWLRSAEFDFRIRVQGVLHLLSDC